MKNALSNVNGWLGGFVGLLKTVIVFFVFAAIVWPAGLPNVVGGIVGVAVDAVVVIIMSCNPKYSISCISLLVKVL